MIIDEILNYDFNNETDCDRLKSAVITLQNYCNDTKVSEVESKVVWEGVFDNLEDVFKEVWEDDWCIDDDGTIQLLYDTKCLIESNRLTDENWLSYILGKDWGKWSKGQLTFYFAYLEALKRVGIKKIEIDIETDKCKFIN